jgi:hypothetical protein
MKSITELKDIHKGEDIYIIASGKSFDFISGDFFGGKITIGVNQVYKRITCDYLVRKETKFLEPSLETGSKVIVSKHNCGNLGSNLNNSESDNDNLYYFNHLHNQENIINTSVFGTDNIVVSYSTITSAIHMAAYMGAKNIILVGHDCGAINGEFTFNGYYDSIQDTPWSNWEQYKNWLKVIESQTIVVKNEIKKIYDANVLSINPFVSMIDFCFLI